MKIAVIPFLVMMSFAGSVSTPVSPAFAASSDQSSPVDYVVPMGGGGNSIYIYGGEQSWEIGVLQADGHRASLLNAKQIGSVSVFKDAPSAKGISWQPVPVSSSNGALDTARTWFFLASEKGAHFIRYTNNPASLYEAFTFDTSTAKVKAVSATSFNIGMNFRYLFSWIGEDGKGQTYIVDPASGDAAKLTDSFIQLERNQATLAKYDSATKILKIGESADLHFDNNRIRPTMSADLSQLRISSIPQAQGMVNTQRAGIGNSSGSTISPYIARIDESNQRLRDMQPDSDNILGLDTSDMLEEVKGYMHGRPPARSQGGKTGTAVNSGGGPSPRNAPANPDAPNPAQVLAQLPQGASEISITYGDAEFLVYVSNDPAKKGTYIQRSTDKLIVKISPEPVPLANADGDPKIAITVEDGILKHPALLRQIDLDAFKYEATFSPRTFGPAEVEWFEGQFIDAKTDGTEVIKPVKSRQPVIDSLVAAVTKTKNTSKILTGSAGDEIDIIRTAGRKLPRTWEFRVLDTAVLGADTGSSGDTEERIRLLRGALSSKPYVLLCEGFDNLKGQGATEGSKRDILDLLRPDFRDGYVRILGTGTGSFSERINDPALLNAMDRPEKLFALSLTDTIEALQEWLKVVHPEYPVPDEGFFQEIMKMADRFDGISEEPLRSKKLLEKIYLHLEEQKQLDPAHLNRTTLRNSAEALYRLPDYYFDRLKRIHVLNHFVEGMQVRVKGHEHIIYDLKEQIEAFYKNQHDSRGPAVSGFFDGPPGVGKTELVEALAEVLGLELIKFEMGQYPGTDAKTIERFMAKLGAETTSNPRAIILFDEFEKASIEVQNALLTAMSNKRFEYTIDGRSYYSSLKQTMAFGTANSIGDRVEDFFFELPEEKRNRPSTELAEEFFDQMPEREYVNAVVNAGVSKPLFDRFNKLRTVCFPPSKYNYIQIMKMKLTQLLRLTADGEEASVKMSWINDEAAAEEVAEKAIKQGWSTRKALGTIVKIGQQRTSGLLYRETPLKDGDHVTFDLHPNTAHECAISVKSNSSGN